MSFLAGLLPALGGLLPGIVRTVGNVIGKVTSGDFGGALGEVGKALSGGAGDALANVAKDVGKTLEKRQEDDIRRQEELKKQEQMDFERELENRRKLMHLEFEREARKRQLNRMHVQDGLPMWRGRQVQPPLRAPQQQVSAPYMTDVDEEEERYNLPPVTRRRRNKRRN